MEGEGLGIVTQGKSCSCNDCRWFHGRIVATLLSIHFWVIWMTKLYCRRFMVSTFHQIIHCIFRTHANWGNKKHKNTVLSLLPDIRVICQPLYGKCHISGLANMSRKVNSSWLSAQSTAYLKINLSFSFWLDCRRLLWIMDGYCVCFIYVDCMRDLVVTVIFSARTTVKGRLFDQGLQLHIISTALHQQ